MATIFDRLLLAKLEATKGTDAVPTAAQDAMRVKSFAITVNQSNVDRAVVKQTMGNLPHLVDPDASASIEIVWELKGSGTAGTAPESSPIIQACRTLETVGAGIVSYAPSTATEKSCTIYAYKDGLLWRFVGAVGTISITENIGEAPTATASMQAVYAAPVVAAVPAGAVYDATAPSVVSSADVISDGLAIRVGAFSIDLGNDVQEHKIVNLHEFTVSNRNPTITFSKDSVATAAEWAALRGGTNASISSTVGATAGNIVSVSAPQARRQSVAYGERAERDTLDVTYTLFESTSDDQFTITFS